MGRLGLIALLALAAAPGALAGGGVIAAVQSPVLGPSVPGSATRYVALSAANGTVVAVARRDGSVLRSRLVPGTYGVPLVTMGGRVGGLSRDGKLLVLGDAIRQLQGLRQQTHLLVVRTRDLAPQRRIDLRGDFTFDALSPGAATLYLIQHVSARNAQRYRVRAYDLRAGRLLDRVIADKTQPGWTMSGYPVARTSSPDGRWVYTLYRQRDNYPFVHALDTVGRRAVCIAVNEPWKGNPATKNLTGGLRLDGTLLHVADRDRGPTRYTIDLATRGATSRAVHADALGW